MFCEKEEPSSWAENRLQDGDDGDDEQDNSSNETRKVAVAVDDGEGDDDQRREWGGRAEKGRHCCTMDDDATDELIDMACFLRPSLLGMPR